MSLYMYDGKKKFISYKVMFPHFVKIFPQSILTAHSSPYERQPAGNAYPQHRHTPFHLLQAA